MNVSFQTAAPGVAAFGCVLSQVQVASANAAEAETVLKALHDHRFVVLHGQDCSVAQLHAFAAQLGRPIPHILERFCVPEHRAILKITNLYDQNGKPAGVHDGGNYWHTDMSYLPHQGVLTALHSLKVPPKDGATKIMDCVGATRRLLAADGQHYWQGVLLEPLRVTHRFGNREARRDGAARTQPLQEREAGQVAAVVEHPLLRRHPRSGKAAVFAVAATASSIVGWDDDHAAAFLDNLFDFLKDDAEVYTHEYRAGDIVIWDNMLTLHSGTEIAPTTDADTCRLLHRFNVDYLAAAAIGPAAARQLSRTIS